MLETSARAWPDRVAIVDGPTRLTYAELWKSVLSAAGGLAGLGVQEGDHVALYMAESWRHIAIIYAVMHLGAVAVPLNLAWEADEIEHALTTADVDWLIAGRTHRDRDLSARLSQLEIREPGSLTNPRLPRLRGLIADWDAPGPSTTRALLASTPGNRPPSRNRLGYIMFTSGSTARPKGAVITQEAALGCAYYVAERLKIAETDRFLNVMPFYHCGGLVDVFLVVHQRGAEVAIFEGYQHEPMLEALWRDQSAVLIGFDVVTMRLVRGTLERHGRVPIQRMITGPGINVYDELNALGIDVAIIFALTEASNIVSLGAENDSDQHKRESNGFPIPGVDVRIYDPETQRPVAATVPGEIAFRGWNLMHGYYRSGGKSELVLDDAGFFHTGDYGYLDDDGRVYYRGRYAAMVKTGGENVSQVEVENFLMGHVPGVRQSAVVGIPDERWGEIVVAFVEVDPSRRLSSEQIRDVCRGHIAGFKIPKVVIEVEPGEWPVTPTGKINKRELVERALLKTRRRT
jgi:acyl-CoA synthetase (AMP-forming)/AMP-acid ligase II